MSYAAEQAAVEVFECPLCKGENIGGAVVCKHCGAHKETVMVGGGGRRLIGIVLWFVLGWGVSILLMVSGLVWLGFFLGLVVLFGAPVGMRLAAGLMLKMFPPKTATVWVHTQ